MRIRVRTAGTLGEYLPPGSARNRAEIEVPEGATPLAVMRRLGFPMENQYLVSLNGSAVIGAERDSTPLAENDELAIMPPLRGG